MKHGPACLPPLPCPECGKQMCSESFTPDSRGGFFEASLNTGGDRSFARLSWESFLRTVEDAVGQWPPWMRRFLTDRKLLAVNLGEPP